MAFLKASLFLLSTLSSLALANPLKQERADPITTFGDKVIYTPPANYNTPRVLYARTAELTHSGNDLLATWENYSPEPPLVYFPIYKSKDHGLTWKHISNVTDQVNGWGLRYQPFLYELPEAFAGYPAGTVLLAGNSIPTDLSKSQIDLYASKDGGLTWKFLSHIALGGVAKPDNGLTPVWEPFILLYKGQLVVYYSDQRDKAHGQKMVHQTTTDLLKWTAPVDDVSYAEYTDRPGMPTVAQLPTGDYILAYEWGHNFSGSYAFAVTYRISANPLAFNSATPHRLRAANTGTQPEGSPYVVWSSTGGKNGTIIVTSGGRGTVFTNKALGDAGQWFEYKTPEPTSYSRHLRVFAEDQTKLLIAGGGPLNGHNSISLSVVDIGGLAKA